MTCRGVDAMGPWSLGTGLPLRPRPVESLDLAGAPAADRHGEPSSPRRARNQPLVAVGTPRCRGHRRRSRAVRRVQGGRRAHCLAGPLAGSGDRPPCRVRPGLRRRAGAARDTGPGPRDRGPPLRSGRAAACPTRRPWPSPGPRSATCVARQPADAPRAGPAGGDRPRRQHPRLRGHRLGPRGAPNARGRPRVKSAIRAR
jgi:hypothetical protein